MFRQEWKTYEMDSLYSRFSPDHYINFHFLVEANPVQWYTLTYGQSDEPHRHFFPFAILPHWETLAPALVKNGVPQQGMWNWNLL